MPEAGNPQNPNQPGNSTPEWPPPLPEGGPPESKAPNPQRTALGFLRHEGGDQVHADPVANVTIPGGPVTITESAEALFAAIGPRKQLFYRGGVVVELVDSFHCVPL